MSMEVSNLQEYSVSIAGCSSYHSNTEGHILPSAEWKTTLASNVSPSTAVTMTIRKLVDFLELIQSSSAKVRGTVSESLSQTEEGAQPPPQQLGGRSFNRARYGRTQLWSQHLRG